MKQRYLDRYPGIKEGRAAQRAAKAEARRIREEMEAAGKAAVREAARSTELERVRSALEGSGLPEGVRETLLAAMTRRRLGMTAIIESLPSLAALVEQYGAHTVQRWLARSPFVLSALETVPSRLSTLASLAAISYEDAVALTARCPIVVGVKPEVMRVRYHELKDILDMSHEDMRVMIQATPVLLAMSTPRIATKWQRLKALSQTRDEWRRSMESFHPATLGIQLTYSMDRFARIEFLAEQAARVTSARESGDGSGDGDGIYLRRGFSSILGLSAAAFDQQYPAFREWLARREALGQHSED